MVTPKSFTPDHLEQLAIALNKKGLEDFIDDNENYLCLNTRCSSVQLMVTLCINLSDRQKIVNDIPIEYDRNHQIYQIVRIKGDCERLLNALAETDNQHIIKFIWEKLEFVYKNDDDDDGGDVDDDADDSQCQNNPPPSSQDETLEEVEGNQPLMPQPTETAPPSDPTNSSSRSPQRSDVKITFCDNRWIPVLLFAKGILLIVIGFVVGVLLYERSIRPITTGAAAVHPTTTTPTTTIFSPTITTTTTDSLDMKQKVRENKNKYFPLDIDSPVSKLQATPGTLLHLIIRSNYMTSSHPSKAGMKIKKYNWLNWRPLKGATELVKVLTLEGYFDTEEIEYFLRILPNLDTLCFKETCMPMIGPH